MTEEKLFAKLGRQGVKIEEQDEAYTLLLERFAGLVSGELDRSRVLVNLTDRTWLVSEPSTRPPMPATVNGLPRVVVAPDEPKINVVCENEPPTPDAKPDAA